ncbi:uroporphyrinogen-III synthase [Metallibacterium sp.]|uniref:uroporphyrinogen-III synthase n=1 Tax=Metallibacterium sp. TaxID=2940281 RepID=UPI00261DA14F|nr:uroporphyrinogen-III synthase [Metallibacterium sp.]
MKAPAFDAAAKPSHPSLHGATLVLTRAVGSAQSEARRVRALGGHALLLPGSRLAPAADAAAARAALRAALRAPLCIFVSPAAVRAATHLNALIAAPRTRVLAVGAATARVLRRHGVFDVEIPARADSEGLLALPALTPPPLRVGLIGAPGGRELLPRALAARGAQVLRADVYRRLPAHLDRRHLLPLQRARAPLYVLLSSSEALAHLMQSLPTALRARLLAGTAIASSARVASVARAAGFAQVHQARSALSADLLAGACAVHARRRGGGA